MKTLAWGVQDNEGKMLAIWRVRRRAKHSDRGVRVATKGDSARETLAAGRSHAIRHAPANGKPRRREPDWRRIETLCVRTPVEEAPRCWEARQDVGWRNAETPEGGSKNAGLRHAEMPRVEAPTRGGGKGRAERLQQDAG